jgi:FkbH-like protein
MTSATDDLARAETPGADACLALARDAMRAGDTGAAYSHLISVADTTGSFRPWAAAAALLSKLRRESAPPARREIRVALAGSYTTAQLGPLLELAALRRGMHVALHEVGYDLYTQEILDPDSALHRFRPDYVLLAPHDGALPFPNLADDPAVVVEQEVRRWQSLWRSIEQHAGARIVQHNIAIRPESAWGHVASRIPGSRDELLRAFNARLAEVAGENVLLVDCDRIAATIGKARWFDDRYLHLAKQAVALDALPDLARHTAAVLAGAEGLSTKCVVLDLDNTLWGGVIAEDGLSGIALGPGSPVGEAYVAFQEHLAALRSRGIILAVVSKNNDADARVPFESHPDMRLRLDDFAVFLANWDDKATNIRRVAETLGIGLDALAFVDDNPAEREVVRQLLPEVEVVNLPRDAARYTRTLADTLLFETAAVTEEDLGRAGQYAARAAAVALQADAASLEDFYASLQMEALVAPFDELNLPRIAQLVAKTNQFNLTTRRHGPAELHAFADDPDYVTLYLRLRDKFVDHGLVAVLVARHEGDVLDIDTWLMSCRVIGRTVEREMLMRLCEAAADRGVSRLRGTYVPTAKNGLVRDLYERLGFDAVARHDDGSTVWEYDIDRQGTIRSEFIESWLDAVAHA